MFNSLFDRMKASTQQQEELEDANRRELLRIIHEETITPLFQPIVHARKGTIYGYETLSRGPEGSPLHLPEPLFSTARRHNLLFALDSLCRRQAIARFQQLALEGQLFINIDPLCLLDKDHQQGATLDALRKHHLGCKRVVIELTEHQQIEDMAALKQAAAHYRNMGFTIAMDDLSAGYSNLQLMNELRPEFIKLDKYFIRKLAHDPVAREFTRAICKLARSIDCAVIAEGIEQTADLAAVRDLKIEFAQGYLLGRPSSVPEPLRTDNEIIVEQHSPSQPQKEQAEEIGALALPVEPAQPSTRAEVVFERLQKDSSLMAIPIVDHGIVVGICERNAMLQRFAIRYGHELYGSKPVEQVMNNNPLVVDTGAPIEEVSPQITSRSPLTLYEPVVLTKDGHYAGIVYVHDILDQITKLSINRAMESNPLTRLPGNITIEREVNRRLIEKEAFILCYIDLDNFKAFNDRYGYERGDAMIRLLADILRDFAKGRDFIGHIGGDDFIFMLEERVNWKETVEKMMEEFRRQAVELYDRSDAANGCIRAKDRAGNLCTFGLASLSIGAVPCPPGRYRNHLETSEVAVKLKHQAKLHSGNALMIDRRQKAGDAYPETMEATRSEGDPAMMAANQAAAA